MKNLKFIFYLLMIAFFCKCTKEPINSSIPNNNHNLNSDTCLFQFSGNILEHSYNWTFNSFKNSIGACCGSYWCITNDKHIQMRYAELYDLKQLDSVTKIYIGCPLFCIDSSFQYKKNIFSPGKKKFSGNGGNLYENFEIRVSTKDQGYSTYFGDQSSSNLEISKVEEIQSSIIGQGKTRLRIWINLSCSLYNATKIKFGYITNSKLIFEIEIEANK